MKKPRTFWIKPFGLRRGLIKTRPLAERERDSERKTNSRAMLLRVTSAGAIAAISAVTALARDLPLPLNPDGSVCTASPCYTYLNGSGGASSTIGAACKIAAPLVGRYENNGQYSIVYTNSVDNTCRGNWTLISSGEIKFVNMRFYIPDPRQVSPALVPVGPSGKKSIGLKPSKPAIQ